MAVLQKTKKNQKIKNIEIEESNIIGFFEKERMSKALKQENIIIPRCNSVEETLKAMLAYSAKMQ